MFLYKRLIAAELVIEVTNVHPPALPMADARIAAGFAQRRRPMRFMYKLGQRWGFHQLVQR